MGLSGETRLILAATSVPFLALEVFFYFRYGAWLRRRDEVERQASAEAASP
jgi:hypothetical protein